MISKGKRYANKFMKTTEILQGIENINNIVRNFKWCLQVADTAPGFRKWNYFNFMTVSGGTSADIPAITAKTAADFQLSQEESGFSLIIQDVSKDSEHVIQLNLEKVCFTNLWWQQTNKQTPPKQTNKQTNHLSSVNSCIRTWARYVTFHTQ